MTSATHSYWAAFDAAYKKACESSQPQDWMQAALLAQQVRHAGPLDEEKPVAWLNEDGRSVITDAKLKEMASGLFSWAIEKHWKNPTPLYRRHAATTGRDS